MPEIDASFPQKMECLFQPKRYKVFWGGRGAGRSWNIARGLLLMGAGMLPDFRRPPVRVLCVRELQNSLSESVHQVLEDQISLLGLDAYYKVQRDYIVGIGPALGTVFSFEGIKNNTNRIKSYEGVDIVWAEEAVKITRGSWGVLIPTIRKEDSEIWMSFNPELETDYTYTRFVKQADPTNSVVVHMTWKDNPWFPQVLQEEMQRDKERDPDYYLNVWEGQCVQQLEGAVYAKELRRAAEEGRICDVPWEREWPVSTFWDLGKRHATCIWFAQRVAMQYRILNYYENTAFDIGDYIKHLQRLEYRYDFHYLPHDAKAKRMGMKLTIEEQMRIHFPNSIRIVPKLSVEDGINAAKMIFPNCWFDEDNTHDGLHALRHYRYRVVDNNIGNDKGLSAKPVDDWSADGADAYRYLAVGFHMGRREQTTITTAVMDRYQAATREMARAGSRFNPLGWMR